MIWYAFAETTKHVPVASYKGLVWWSLDDSTLIPTFVDFDNRGVVHYRPEKAINCHDQDHNSLFKEEVRDTPDATFSAVWTTQSTLSISKPESSPRWSSPRALTVVESTRGLSRAGFNQGVFLKRLSKSIAFWFRREITKTNQEPYRRTWPREGRLTICLEVVVEPTCSKGEEELFLPLVKGLIL